MKLMKTNLLFVVSMLVACNLTWHSSATADPLCPGSAVAEETFVSTRDFLCAEPRARRHKIELALSFLDGVERPRHHTSALALLRSLNSVEAGAHVPLEVWNRNLTDPEAAIVRRSLRVTLIEQAFSQKQIEDWCTALTFGNGNAPTFFGDIEYAVRCGQ
jgi:hypothetical protein